MPTLASLDPADGATWIYRNKPVTLELTRADSNDYVKIETTQADFAAGTLTDTQARTSNDLAVLKRMTENFEDDTVGQEPAGWSFTGSFPTHAVYDLSGNKVYRMYNGHSGSLRWDAAGSRADWDVKGRFQMTMKAVGHYLCLRVRVSGAGSTFCCYSGMLVSDNDNLYLQRVVNSSTYTIQNVPFAFNQNAWYWIRLQAIGTAIKLKAWADGSAEPAGWNISVTDTYVPGPGAVHLYGEYATPDATWYFDDITAYGIGDYATTGSRVSPAYSLATVGKAGMAYIDWDEDLPSGTSMTLKTSIDGGSTWSAACTKGQRIEGIDDGDDLAAVSIKVKCEMATTDVSHTPVLSEVRLTFMPQDPALVEVLVNGVSYTAAAGTLTYWKLVKVVGTTITDPCRQDVYYATFGPTWWQYGPAEITVVVKYDGSTLSTTTFETASDERYSSRIEAWWLPRVLGGMFDGPMGALAHYFVGGIEPWLIRVEAHYHVTTMPRMGFDAYYWVAHLVSWDGPGAVAVGHPALTDGPASVTVQAYAHGDGPGAVVVQGYVRGDGPGAVAAGVPMRGDGPAAVIAATPAVEDGPAAAVTYEVNRRNIVEIKSVSAATKAAMDELELEADEE